MKSKILRRFIILATCLVVLLNIVALLQARTLVNNPLADRKPLDQNPSDFDLIYEDVQVTTSDNLMLNGWYIPSQNSALIIMQHGYKWNRVGHLEEAVMFANAGYGVLITSVRAHDVNPGEKITFGVEEMKDLEAWTNFARSIADIDQEKIGMLGDSLGGSMVIQFAAKNDIISAVVAHSAFSSLQDTIETSIRHYTGLPPFPFAPLIKFWAELDLGISINEIDAKKWIPEISPRPILLIHSLDDEVISGESGQLLFDAALEPKQLWLENGINHADFDTTLPDEFENRVVGFFNQHFFADTVSSMALSEE